MRLQEGNPVKKGTDTLRVKKDLQPGAPQRVGRYHFDSQTSEDFSGTGHHGRYVL